MLFFIFQGQAFAQSKSLQFDEREIPQIILKAKASEKLIFVDVTAVWCVPCKELEKTVFHDSVVTTFFNENFIIKKFDLDAIRQDSISNWIKSHTSGVPHFYFLDTDGNVILTDGGLKSKSEFIQMGQKAIANKHLTAALKQFDFNYPKMINDESFLLDYMTLRKQAGMNNSDILKGYLSIIPKEDLLKDNVLNIIIENEENIDGEGYKIITSNENKLYIKMHTKDPLMEYNMYVAALNIIQLTARDAFEVKDRKLFDKCLAENMRVFQNKDNAKMQNEAMLEAFEKSIKNN